MFLRFIFMLKSLTHHQVYHNSSDVLYYALMVTFFVQTKFSMLHPYLFCLFSRIYAFIFIFGLCCFIFVLCLWYFHLFVSTYEVCICCCILLKHTLSFGLFVLLCFVTCSTCFLEVSWCPITGNNYLSNTHNINFTFWLFFALKYDLCNVLGWKLQENFCFHKNWLKMVLWASLIILDWPTLCL